MLAAIALFDVYALCQIYIFVTERKTGAEFWFLCENQIKIIYKQRKCPQKHQEIQENISLRKNV